MSRVAYVNGKYVAHADAAVAVEDRGYQFADGIYEYIAFYNRTFLDADLHLKRLARSLNELHIAMPVAAAALPIIMQELLERNGREDGGLYMQVSRGVARRDHVFPKEAKPSLVMTVCAAKSPKPQELKQGVKVITAPDIRWGRCDIKSLALLANVLAKQDASAHKAREAWLIRDQYITEGAVSNAYIIDGEGAIVTHPADHQILAGITRDVVLKLAKNANIPVKEKPFSLKDVKNAAEAFITSTSANVLPVTQMDDQPVATGNVGPVVLKLQALYAKHVLKQTGKVF